MPQIEVTFDIDANGILNVSAKDKATNKEQKITITASTGLSKEEAERMQKEAEAHAAEDKARLSEVEARNRLDSLVYQTEKMVKENREKLAEADVKAAEEAIEDARHALVRRRRGAVQCRRGCTDEGFAPDGRSAVQNATERRWCEPPRRGQRTAAAGAAHRTRTRRCCGRRVRGRGRFEEA